MDRALGLLDTTIEEWADYISFLSRLLKALHNHPEGVHVVPSKFIVAKRLAQCLHPSLPSGVHQKALEVYTFIFAFVQADGLAEDLGVYFPGMASVLTFASISVRPRFLSLIEDYVLRIPVHALRPALKALILALLPGLEEQTSEEFDKTIQILSQCKSIFSSAGLGEVFWQNLFLASITSSSRRQGVLAYLSRCLPKLGQAGPDTTALVENELVKNSEIAAVTTPELGLLLRCFATGLTDEHILVQRAFLDLLVTHVPLHAPIFERQVVAEDLELLMSAATGVVLRRDMSLNRRLWSWFSGPQPKEGGDSEKSLMSSSYSVQLENQEDVESPNATAYFRNYAVKPLIQSLQTTIAHASEIPSKASRPFRIALSLMDKWEIGSPVVNEIFLPLIRSLRQYQQNATSKEDFEEVFRSANVFFDGVESSLIWSKILSLVLPAERTREEILCDMDLAAFVIINFNVREEEMIVIHMPLVSLTVLDILSRPDDCESGHASPLIDKEVQSAMYHLLHLMIDMIPDRAFTNPSNSVLPAKSALRNNDDCCGIQEKIKLFFESNKDSLELPEPPFSPQDLGQQFLRLLSSLIMEQIRNDASGSDISRSVQLFSLLLQKLPSHDGLVRSRFAACIKQRFDETTSRERKVSFSLLSSATSLFVSLFVGDAPDKDSQADDISATVSLLVRHLWKYLSFSSPQHHVETVHHLEDLQYLFSQEETVTSTVLCLLLDADMNQSQPYQPSKETLDRYATLWTHYRSRPKPVAPSNTNLPQDSTSVDQRRGESVAAFSSMLEHAMISILSVLRGHCTEVQATCRNWLQGFTDLSRFDNLDLPTAEN